MRIHHEFFFIQGAIFLLLFIIQTGVVYIAFQTPLIIYSQHSAWVVFILASVIHYGLLCLFEQYYPYFYLNGFFAGSIKSIG